MKILITGANGFLGKNLQLHLAERKDIEVVCFTRANNANELPNFLVGVDFIFHLAGVNRPPHPDDFITGNADLTQQLCAAIAGTSRRIPIIYTSSIQAALENPYGYSKRLAEEALFNLQKKLNNPVYVFRLPNVFGKWCRPNYNSAVATFCHNISRGLPIQVNDPDATVNLVYVDDVIARFLQLMDGARPALNSEGFDTVTPQYEITIGQLVNTLNTFKNSRTTLVTEKVGTGFLRALYSTYVSYLPSESFSYAVPKHGDPRGVFVEMLKTLDSGQFSYFTAHPGVTRGGHYHHSKTEKFLVIKGKAHFKFRHMNTGEKHELVTTGETPEIVETVPGWTHDITNVGQEEMIVMLWANEIFDRDKPDTFACKVIQ